METIIGLTALLGMMAVLCALVVQSRLDKLSARVVALEDLFQQRKD